MDPFLVGLINVFWCGLWVHVLWVPMSYGSMCCGPPWLISFVRWVDNLMIALPPGIALLWMVITINFLFSQNHFESLWSLNTSVEIMTAPRCKIFTFYDGGCPAIRANIATKIKGRIILFTITFMLSAEIIGLISQKLHFTARRDTCLKSSYCSSI